LETIHSEGNGLNEKLLKKNKGTKYIPLMDQLKDVEVTEEMIRELEHF